MKNKGMVIILGCLFFLVAAAGSASAFDITDTGTSGLTIDIEASPNVELDYNGTATDYAITGWNSQGTLAYGAVEDFTGIYQMSSDSLPTAAASDTEGAAPTEDSWTKMGITGGS